MYSANKIASVLFACVASQMSFAQGLELRDIHILKNQDGTMDVSASVLTPNGCYYSAGAIGAAPMPTFGSLDTAPVTAKLGVKSGVSCIQALTPVTFKWRGVAQRKYIAVFLVMPDGRVHVSGQKITSGD